MRTIECLEKGQITAIKTTEDPKWLKLEIRGKYDITGFVEKGLAVRYDLRVMDFVIIAGDYADIRSTEGYITGFSIADAILNNRIPFHNVQAFVRDLTEDERLKW